MAQPTFDPMSSPVFSGRKSPWNIYTALLIIALVALLSTMLFLYLEIREFGGFGAVGGPLAQLTQLAGNRGLAPAG